MNTEDFIRKAKAVHGDKYTYDKCVYTRSVDKVTITCPSHGDFTQSARAHLRSSGCSECGRQRQIESATLNTTDFVSKAKDVHGERYDYSQTDYTESRAEVLIICRVHGSFRQISANHLQGNGCKKCSSLTTAVAVSAANRSNTTDFVEKAQQKHGDLYGYEKVEYETCQQKVTLVCRTHGDFEITPASHLAGTGCKKCAIATITLSMSNTLEDFIREAKKAHGSTYDYSKVVYVNNRELIDIVCPEHGTFKQRPRHHTAGHGCQHCSAALISEQKTKYTTESYIELVGRVHKQKYKYTDCIYTGLSFKVTVTCPLHGHWQVTASNHLRGRGCPRCWTCATSSKMQIQWLEWQAVKLGMSIQHADNVGEHKISNSRYHADGYDPVSKTVLEFHGSFWHGCPRAYDQNGINKVKKITFGELYQQTLKKREHILKQGYKVIEKWEIDWLADLKKVKTIQRAFRKWKQRRT